jgi:integrase
MFGESEDRASSGEVGLRKVRFHDLRHTFGSLLIQAGVSPAHVQKQMGHRSIQITIDVYGHLIRSAKWLGLTLSTALLEKWRPRRKQDAIAEQGIGRSFFARRAKY